MRPRERRAPQEGDLPSCGPRPPVAGRSAHPPVARRPARPEARRSARSRWRGGPCALLWQGGLRALPWKGDLRALLRARRSARSPVARRSARIGDRLTNKQRSTCGAATNCAGMRQRKLHGANHQRPGTTCLRVTNNRVTQGFNRHTMHYTCAAGQAWDDGGP